MRIVSLPRPPVRPLAGPPPERVVLAAGSLGYVDAAPDDRARWAHDFRTLVDGLSSPLQVVVRCQTGSRERVHASNLRSLPPPQERRRQDLAFAQALRHSPEAQQREVFFVVAPSASPLVRQALRDIGVAELPVLNVERTWQHEGEEAAGWWWDDTGLHRTWYLERFPGGELEPGWLRRLLPKGLDLALSWHADRLPPAWVVEYLRRQLIQLRASQMAPLDAGDPALAGALPAAERLQRQVVAREENAFHLSLYLTVSTHGPKELHQASAEVEATARSAMCVAYPCTFRHREGRIATLPLGIDPLARRRVCDTSSLVTFFPWFDADLQSPTGVILGKSRSTGQPVLIDPFDETRHANANIGVFGHSGAGKTYLLCTLAMGALANGCQIFVVDPEYEYGKLAELLGGVSVSLVAGGRHALNVLHRHGIEGDETVLGSVLTDVVDLCVIICGELDEPERAAVEEAARRAFSEQETPVLSDVAERLDPASRAARVLSRWARGSLGQMFSRETNINLDAEIVVFGMRELKEEMVAPVHFLLAQALWGRIKRRDRRRLLIIDELGLLFEDPAIRRFVVTLARRIRKYNSGLIFATQNQGDLLGSEAGAVVATNPSIHFFGSQRPGEAVKLQRYFRLSDRQRVMLEVARRGEFLLSAGADRIPIRVEAPPWQAAAMQIARMERPPPPR
jgi:Helicase HerA, central domain